MSAQITVYQRPCDFCPTITPMPTLEQLDEILAESRVRSFVLSPCVQSGFHQVQRRDYAQYVEYQYRPEGWELLGVQSWACPDCVKKVEAALGDGLVLDGLRK